jgi:hypothetical protein
VLGKLTILCQILAFGSTKDDVADQLAESIIAGFVQKILEFPRVVLVVGRRDHTGEVLRAVKPIIAHKRPGGTILNIQHPDAESFTPLERQLGLYRQLGIDRQLGMVRRLASEIAQWKGANQSYPGLVNLFIDWWNQPLIYHNYLTSSFYSSWPFKTGDHEIFKELAKIFDRKDRPASVTEQLPEFDFKRVTIFIAIEIDDFVYLPEWQIISSTQVNKLYSSLLARLGSRILSNVWKVILLPIDLRYYNRMDELFGQPQTSNPSR